MATSNKRIVEIHDVDEQASGPGGNGAKPVSVFGWMGTAVKGAGSACFHMLTGPAAGPLILACVCAALAYGTKRPRKLPVLHRSMSIAALHGGEVALERILDAQEARVNEAALKSAADRMRELLAADPKTISYRELHRVAAKLEMSGREDEAIEMLQKAVAEAEKKKQPHEAHELQMVLVEMLIYKGEYQRALQCKCLQWKCQKDEENSDARGPLYMAIIYSITGDKRAKECYERFRDIRRRFHWPDSIAEGSPLYDIMVDFDKFVTAADKLKKEIEHAKTMHK